MRKSQLLSLAFIVLVSCTERDKENDCTKRPAIHNCTSAMEAGSEGKLTVLVTRDARNPVAIIKLYKGETVESGTLIKTDTLTEDSKEYMLPDGEYSGSATYKILYKGVEKTIISIDRDKLRSDHKTYCEGECYEPDYESIDLRIPAM